MNASWTCFTPPRVSTWDAVRLLVERLEAEGINWERTPAGWVKVYNEKDMVAGMEHGWPSPEALARAVVARREAQGG